MKYFILSILLILIAPAHAEAPLNIDGLIKQVQQEAEQERQHNRQREKRFIAERNQQKKRLSRLRTELAQAKAHAEKLRQRFDKNEESLVELDERLRQESGGLNDLFAVVRQNAVELGALTSRSMVSAQYPGRNGFLELLNSRGDNSVSMEDLKKIWVLLLDEMNQTGKVVRFEAPIITTGGEEVSAQVTRSGVFNATTEGRFLRYLPETGKLVELARQPALRYREMAHELEQAETGLHTMAVDPTKGSILALLVQSPDMWERIRQGSVIGYLILTLGAIGLLIVFYRYVVLGLINRRMKRQLKSKKPETNNPLGRLMTSTTELAHSSTEVITMRLDEIINAEARRLNLGLTTLTVFAAVAPLLGLLGTVTGMIETFQSISLYGTGDPRLMSSGISLALITTQLGLAVAIPLLLLHTFLQGKASRLVDILDEQGAKMFESNDHRVNGRD